MDDKRLQEIIEEWSGITDGDPPKSVQELIAAVEELQAEVERLQRNNNANEEYIAEHGI